MPISEAMRQPLPPRAGRLAETEMMASMAAVPRVLPQCRTRGKRSWRR